MKHPVILTLTAALMAFPLLSAQAQNGNGGDTPGKKNLTVKEWNTGARGTASTLDHQTIYSSEGRKLEETEYDSNGKQKWRKRYEWGPGGKIARELVYDERNRLVNYKKFEYNSLGKKKLQYTYDPKGKLISTKMFEYITSKE